MSARNDFRDVDVNDIGRWYTESMEDAMRTDDEDARRDYLMFAWQCEAELNRRTPNSHWSAIRLVNWYQRATVEEVWWAVDPYLYKHPCKAVAATLGVSIDTVHSYRKALFRAKQKPSFENFVKLLSI